MTASEEENLDMLLSLFAESESQEQETPAAAEGSDNLDDLFDEDDDGDPYIEPEEEDDVAPGKSSSAEGDSDLNKSKEDLEAELKLMQQKMQKLQQQLEASQKTTQPENKPSVQRQTSTKSLTPPQGVSKTPPPTRQDSDGSPPSDVTAKLKNKQRTAHQSKAAASERQTPIGQSMNNCQSQPISDSAKVNSTLKSPPPLKTPPTVCQATPRSSVSQEVAVEKFSGLRLRNPRLSSIDIEQKMASRRLIKLSQLPDRLARDNLEDSDWVTFAVVINKITPQSKNNGKTFSIWKLNDLHNLEVNVSLFLFGSVHTDLWKTDTGTVIGILNPNPMKNKDGSNELCLTVDHPQKVLIMGEAMDFGTCKAKKKNGDSCTQLVNLFECQYCQYHVKAQYKKMSSKRSELQSSFTGSAPGKGRGRGSLRERLCQSDFHYGGMSSLASAPSMSAPQPKKQPTIQSVLASIPTKKLVLNSGKVSGCSDDFKGLMSMPTPGALHIKKHLGQAKNTAVAGSSVQSISASDLLKQQKEEHQQRMLARKKRAEEIQKRVLQSSAPSWPNASRGPLLSPKAASEVPKGSPGLTSRLSGPPVPTLGRGFSEGEDIFLDLSAPSSKGLSAAKLAAVRKLQAKGSVMVKDDPNAVKRKRANSDDIADRVERNLSTPKVSDENSTGEEEEPAQKKRREQLEYIQSEEFQRILNAKSSNSWMMGEIEERAMQEYFEPLVQKEKMEEKMKSIREMKCRAVTCKTCKYTHFKPADRCVEEKHDYHWHDAVKRFFKCPCGQRKICLARMPHGACSHCGLFKWERDGMLKEKKGPKIGGELLLPRGEEQPKFLSSLK
ncbi:protein MCM10 homolog isoform X1 [Sinocyclocheilus rhinocerous]|uniref:protein MCM10 homolog isoform X1 n=1 Tax=Sinocyclocheilus rhinocerous TaxID=307959 RepID=UPI0007BA8420|nr:PREDICTED: protein MCM10 homolog isoform X1 [Sinocyclocheilus rhinocerous]